MTTDLKKENKMEKEKEPPNKVWIVVPFGKKWQFIQQFATSGVGALSGVVLYFHERKIFNELLLSHKSFKLITRLSKNSDRKGVFPFLTMVEKLIFYLLLAINTHFKVQRKIDHILAKNKTSLLHNTET